MWTVDMQCLTPYKEDTEDTDARGTSPEILCHEEKMYSKEYRI